MEESKPNIKEEIQDPFFDSKSLPLSVELKTENTPIFPCPETSLSFEDNIDSALHGIGLPSIVESDLNAYLSCSENEKKGRKTRQKKVIAPESSDNYFSSDTEVRKKRSKKSKKKQPLKREKKEYNCSFCEKVCRSNSDKIKHERVHTGETPYSCSMCDKSFKQSSYLLKHERNHTGERPYKWVRAGTSNVFIKQEIVRTPFSHICEECDKAFNTATELKQHMRSHTGERPFVCTYCAKAFLHRSNLSAHVRSIHTGERPYKCASCDKSFAQISNLIRHEKAHKRDFEKLMLTYRCSTCDEGFATMEELLKHDETAHRIVTDFLVPQNHEQNHQIQPNQTNPNPPISNSFINQLQ